jgi:threonine/homoserine/homoserine lactone efflux protein
MQTHVFAVFTLALAIAVATPGPGIFAVVSCALGRGFRDAVAMTCGIVVGDLIYFSLAVLGMAALAHSMGDFFLIVKLMGAAYIIWLGFKLWRAKAEVPLEMGSRSVERGFKRSFIGGLTVTLSNPKAIAFYAGLLPTVVDLDRLSASNAILMGVIVVFVVGAIPTLYALAASRTRRFFGSPRKMKLMNRTAGTVMIGAGVAVAVR